MDEQASFDSIESSSFNAGVMVTFPVQYLVQKGEEEKIGLIKRIPEVGPVLVHRFVAARSRPSWMRGLPCRDSARPQWLLAQAANPEPLDEAFSGPPVLRPLRVPAL